MKKFLLSTVTILAFGNMAGAADLPAKVAAPAVVRPACAQFGGFYIGGNVGWGYYDYKFNDRDGLGASIDTTLNASTTATDDGFNGGVQGGYNWQRGCTLFGVEADWSWANNKISQFQTDGDLAAIDTATIESRLRWFGTVRTRAGVVVDDVLIYVTGGFAYANFDRTFSFFEDNPATTGTFSSSNTRWGWTGGVGTEWQWMRNWSVKGEFLYMRFNDDTVTVTGNGVIGNAGRTYNLNSIDSIWVSRIGLNYRF